jgi:Zn-dependent protease with chaperone function
VLHEGLAQALEKQDRFDDTEGEYRKADGSDGHVRLSSFAERLFQRGEIDHSIRISRSIQSAFPADSSTSKDLVTLLVRGAKWSDVDAVCTESLRSQAPSPASWTGSLSLSAGCYDLHLGTEARLAFFRAAPKSFFVDKDKLTNQLASAGRLREAAEVCNSIGLSGCGKEMTYLFLTDRKTDAIRFADEIVEEGKARGEKFPYLSLGWIVDPTFDPSYSDIQRLALEGSSRLSTFVPFTLEGMSLEDRLLVCLEASREGDTTNYVLYDFLHKMDIRGKLTETIDALRHVAPDFAIDASSLQFHIGEQAMNSLLYQGYFVLLAKESVPVGNYGCDFHSFPAIPAGTTVRLSYVGFVSCKDVDGGRNKVLVEYQDRVWSADPLSFSYVIVPVGTPIRPVANKTLEEALASITRASNTSLTLLDEVTLGFTAHTEILKKYKLYTREPAAKASGMRAFRMLMSTPLAHSGNVPSFQLWLLEGSSETAFSTAGGNIYVDKRMLPIVADDVGLWAAVLAHEASHVVKHHQYKAYVRAATLKITRRVFREQMAQGHTWALWAYLVTLTGGRALEMKLSRHDELEADRLGLMMMAEAGIHPDYATALMRRLHTVMGDQNEVAEFLFSDHPRWETREKNIRKARDKALSIFNRQYANAEDSPGGVPPSL